MFYGEYEHTIDRKGRVIVPSKFRDALKDKFVDTFMVTRGYEKCLFVFPPDQWQAYEQTLRALSPHKADPRALSRMFYGGANQCPCDRQGRINIPKILLNYATINKEVAIIGVSTRFEIWDKERWNKYREAEEKALEERAEKIGEIRIE
ncbi:division/cell wall cluster transcriptional repressor MraZ [bacterium]|nr:division/cell wall cluster transcriptional repressor MraZ [bacterium]MCK4325948.1 division/cell wall cluster transcriptional repressor MraZ [bacterium]MCK4436580.1 division/cell wall cluster transcriptional repressor MraZ [bacterium]